jgi:hypothetical protein
MTRRRRIAVAVVAGVGIVVTAACSSRAPDPVLSHSSAVSTTAAATTSAPSDADEFSGTYRVEYADGVMRTWTASPCGQGCADMAQLPDLKGSWSFEAEAHLEGTTWKMSFWDPVHYECGDGRRLAGTATWTWDASTLRGALLGETNSPCGGPLPVCPFVLIKPSSAIPPRPPSRTPC